MALSTANRTSYSGYTALTNDAVSSRRGIVYAPNKPRVEDTYWFSGISFNNPFVDDSKEDRIPDNNKIVGTTKTPTIRPEPPTKPTKRGDEPSKTTTLRPPLLLM